MDEGGNITIIIIIIIIITFILYKEIGFFRSHIYNVNFHNLQSISDSCWWFRDAVAANIFRQKWKNN